MKNTKSLPRSHVVLADLRAGRYTNYKSLLEENVVILSNAWFQAGYPFSEYPGMNRDKLAQDLFSRENLNKNPGKPTAVPFF